MAKKVIEFPKNESELAAFYLGNRFPKGAVVPQKQGEYLFFQKGRACTSQETTLWTKFKLNKKMNKSLQYKFFDKYIDVDLYFFKSTPRFWSNTKDDHMCEFFIKDKELGDTHQLKVYKPSAFGLDLSKTYGYRAYKHFFEEKKQECIKREELRAIFFDVAQRATEEVYGKLPMGLYIIDYKSGMDQKETENANKWRDFVNAELEQIGYQLALKW